MGEATYALEEAVASMGDAPVSDETVSVDLPGRSDLPASADDLSFLIYAGMVDLFADLSLEAADSDTKRVEVLVRSLRALVSAEPVPNSPDTTERPVPKPRTCRTDAQQGHRRDGELVDPEAEVILGLLVGETGVAEQHLRTVLNWLE